MPRVLVALALTLSLSSHAAAGGPREQTGAAAAGMPQIVAPVALPQANLGVTANAALPSASLPSGAAAAPAALPASAVPSAAQAAAPQAAAAAAPPSGPPNGPKTAAAPPSGPPPGGPGRGPDEGPVPGPAGAENAGVAESAHDKAYRAIATDRGALSQLKAELAALEKEQRRLSTTSARIVAGQKDGPSVEAMETADQARRKAEALSPQIQAKRDQLRQARQDERAAYRVLKEQIAQLKSEREKALASAKSADAIGGEFKGGAAEARARALEHAQDLQARIAAKQKVQALLERDNPALAGLRAPIVAAKNALGLAPQTEAEKKLAAEIRELDAAADEKEARAQSLFKTETVHPNMGGAEEGFKWLQVAKKDRAAADAKRAELKKLRGE